MAVVGRRHLIKRVLFLSGMKRRRDVESVFDQMWPLIAEGWAAGKVSLPGFGFFEWRWLGKEGYTRGILKRQSIPYFRAGMKMRRKLDPKAFRWQYRLWMSTKGRKGLGKKPPPSLL